MKRMRTPLLLTMLAVTLLGAVTVTQATAAVIFDNGAPNLATALNSSDNAFQAADNFSLASGQTTITDVHWWGIYGSNAPPLPTDNFVIYIYDDSAGVPGSAIATLPVGSVTRESTGQNVGALNLFAYSVDITPTIVSPATTYWLSVSNQIDAAWYWATSSTGGNAKQRAGSGPWTVPTNGYDLAFNLTDDVTNGGVVPEPSTLLLLGGGMIGLGWRRRRKR